jgi:hypothetical protein
MSDETAVTRIGGIQAKHRLTWDDGDGVARCLCGLTWQWCDADGGHRDEAEILAEWEHHVARVLLAWGVVVGLPVPSTTLGLDAIFCDGDEYGSLDAFLREIARRQAEGAGT